MMAASLPRLAVLALALGASAAACRPAPPADAAASGLDVQVAGLHAPSLHASPAPPPTAAPPPAAEAPSIARRPRLPDARLVDQDGHEQRFDALVQGKYVFFNAIFTSCQATCPMQASVFAQVQKRLGDRVGKDVLLVSVTLDPEVDTPARLKELRTRHGGGPGWVLLTGERAEVKRVLQAMDLWSARPSDHVPMAAVGHEPTGVWRKVLNLKAPVALVEELAVVEKLAQKRLAQGGVAPRQ